MAKRRALGLLALGLWMSGTAASGALAAPKLEPSRRLSQLPLAFEPNVGQTAKGVSFLAHTTDGTVFLTRDGFTLVLPSSPARAVKMRLVGASPARAVGDERLTGTASYFLGSDPTAWRSGVARFGAVMYPEIYPGMDAVFHGDGQRLEFDFRLHPGADVSAIRLAYEGADALSVNSDGDLQLQLGDQVLLQKHAVVYQELRNRRVEVSSRYILDGKSVRFAVGPHDPDQTLVIDPGLVYSSYLGGSAEDDAYAIAVDAAGNAYVTGRTSSANFPTTAGILQGSLDATTDAFITKLNPSGTEAIFSTFIGGNNADVGKGIAVDAFSNVFVTGITLSSDFPHTPGAFQTTANGTTNTWVVKLNPAGTALIYATFVGGAAVNSVTAIALDSAGDAYITGTTNSSNFPVTANAVQKTRIGTAEGAVFVTRINDAGSELLYSTFLSGSSEDIGYGIAVDSSGSAYVAGMTSSIDYPATSGAFQPALGGPRDAFVTKIYVAGDGGLAYSTFLGGAGFDQANAVALDAFGRAVVTGQTYSTDFPVTAAAVQSSLSSAGGVAFVTELNPTGSALVYSTYLGGSVGELGTGVAIDSQGALYAAGNTFSTDFPTTPGSLQPHLPGVTAAFVSKIDPAATPALVYSTYLGGTGEDEGAALALDHSGAVYVIGTAGSTDFPTSAGSFQSQNDGGNDAFITKLDLISVSADGGTGSDAGSDGGTSNQDGGTSTRDGGTPTDAGTTLGSHTSGGCHCSMPGGSAPLFGLVLLLALRRRARNCP